MEQGFKQPRVAGEAREIVRPTEGARVIKVINLKEEFGITNLDYAIRVARPVVQVLNSNRIEYAPLGASAFGIGIEIPEVWRNARPISNIIELQISGRDKVPTIELLTDAGWRCRNITDYFSVTFIDNEGKERISPTIWDQQLFSKGVESRETFLTTIFIPTEFYQVSGNKIRVSWMSDLQTWGETLAYKVTRSYERDRMDLMYVSLVNNMSLLLGERGLEIIKKAAGEDPKKQRLIEGTINYVIAGLKGFEGNGNYDTSLVLQNSEFLSEIKRGMVALQSVRRS